MESFIALSFITSDSRTRSEVPVKSNVFNQVPSDIFNHILGFVDAKTLYSSVQIVSRLFYTILNSQSILNSRLMVLNKSMGNHYVSNLMIDTFGSKEFNIFLLRALNDYMPTFRFINELLDTTSIVSNSRSPFYIGGSLAVIMAHMLQGKEINLQKYSDSDVDIYCIGNHNVMLVQKIILKLISKCFGHVSHYVVIKRFIIDIVFEDPNARKIQIILHMKSNIDEFMEFVDLPITQFLLGGSANVLSRHLYKTKLSQFAIDKKINIMTDPINEQSNNRIVKYTERGFTTVVHAIGQKYCLGHPKSKIISIFDNEYNRYYVDMELDDVFNVLEIISTPILNSAIPASLPINSSVVRRSTRYVEEVDSDVFKGVAYTPLFKVLLHNKKLLISISTKEIQSVKKRKKIINRRRSCRHYYNRYYDSDSDDDYDIVFEEYTCFEKIKETKFGLSVLTRYRYKHNEIADTYHKLQSRSKHLEDSRRPNYPFYFPMSIDDVPKLPGPLFFKSFNSYFLNKSSCVLHRNGTYCDIKFVAKKDQCILNTVTIDNIVKQLQYDELDETELNSMTEEALAICIQNTNLYDRKKLARTISREKQKKSKEKAKRIAAAKNRR